MESSLRVLIVAEHASAKFGGEAILPLHYYRVLRARGVPVWLVVHERTRSELTAMFPLDAHRIHFVPDTALQIALWRIGKRLPARVASFSIGSVMRLLNQTAQRRIIRRLVRDEGITVVHQPMPVSPKEPSMMFAVGAPVIIGPMNGGMNYPLAFQEMQGKFEFITIWAGRKLANIMNRLIPGKRRAALLLVANERTKRALPSCVAKTPVEILVDNGVDLTLWENSPHDKSHRKAAVTRFVFVGRLICLKAIDLLLLAFKRVHTVSPMALSIIGDGTEGAALRQLVRDLCLVGRPNEAGSVHFEGWLSQADCANRLQDADVLVLPSLMECGGAVVLEAMAMAMPVIATNWGGPADYLDNSCGILVNPTTRDSFVDGLAQALTALAGSPQLRLDMGRAGRAKVVQDFDWEIKVNRMLEIYASVTEPTAEKSLIIR